MPSFTDLPAPLAPGDYIFTNPTAPFCLKKLGTLDPNNNITKGQLLLATDTFGQNIHAQTLSCGLWMQSGDRFCKFTLKQIKFDSSWWWGLEAWWLTALQWKVQTAKDPFTGSNYAVTIEYGKTGQNFLNRTGVVGVATGATGESETLWLAVDVNPPGSNGRIMR